MWPWLRHRSAPALALVGWLMLGLTTGCGPRRAASNPVNVVLVVVDTLRPDFLGAYQGAHTPTPHIDRLAADGIVFETALAPSPITAPSHAALFTSRHPSELGLVNNSQSRAPQEIPVLAEILADAGYDTGATIALATLGTEWGFGRGFRVYEEGLRNAWILRADQVLPRTLATLDSLEAPFFLWSHLADPHEPYNAHGTVDHEAEVLARGTLLGQVPTSTSEARLLDLELEQGPNEVLIRSQHPFLVRRLALRQRGWKKPTFEPARPPFEYLTEYRATIHAPKQRKLKLVVQLSDKIASAEDVRKRYALEVSFADRHVGAMLDHLRARGLYDDSLILFTADHGEALGCHGYPAHLDTLYDCMVRIPLIVKPPSGAASEGARRKDPAGLVDLMPTVLGLLGVEPKPLMRGRDLFARGAEDIEPVLFMETHRPQAKKTLFGLRGARFSVILDVAERRWELYDTARDPGQEINIFDAGNPEHMHWADRLRDRMRSEAQRLESTDISEPDEATQEMLRSLGYL